MFKKSTALLLFFFGCLRHSLGAESLHCGRCQWWKCPKTASLSCPGGVVKDICSCCYECGLVEGQPCGDNTVKCGKNLYCRRTNNYDRVGICRPQFDLIGLLGLPPCFNQVGYNKKTDYGCRFILTTFCLKNCRSCCSHRSTCNPNERLYQEAEKCRKEQVVIKGLSKHLKV